MAKILKFEKKNKESNIHVSNDSVNNTKILDISNFTREISLKEWYQRNLNYKGHISPSFYLNLTPDGLIMFFDKLCLMTDNKTEEELDGQDRLLSLLHTYLFEYKTIRDKHLVGLNSWIVECDPVYKANFTAYNLNVQKIVTHSVIDIIVLIMTKLFGTTTMINSSFINSKNTITSITSLWFSRDLKIKIIYLNNKMYYQLHVPEGWNRKRTIFEKMNRKTVYDFVKKAHKNKDVFLYK